MTYSDYLMPAEWEEQTCVQLTWPHADTDWRPYLDDITRTFVQIAKAIVRHEPLVIAAKHPSDVRTTLAESLSDDEMRNVTIYECDNNDTWARDHAFITLVPSGTRHGERLLLDFRFNGWGEKFDADKDNKVNRRMLEQGAFEGERIDYDDFVLEGGSIESDGKGTILTTSTCLLAPHRNQPKTQAQIEEILKKRLHSRKIVWLDHGQLIGDDTDGHIDTIVRPCPDNVIVYVGCDDESDPQYADFKALERQLRDITDADGNHFTLKKLPMPDPIYDGDERLPATYANFLIVNDAVIVPTYDQEDKDQEALRVIAEAFPGREIVPVNSLTIIRQHGSIHCLTMQYPRLRKTV